MCSQVQLARAQELQAGPSAWACLGSCGGDGVSTSHGGSRAGGERTCARPWQTLKPCGTLPRRSVRVQAGKASARLRERRRGAAGARTSSARSSSSWLSCVSCFSAPRLAILAQTCARVRRRRAELRRPGPSRRGHAANYGERAWRGGSRAHRLTISAERRSPAPSLAMPSLFSSSSAFSFPCYGSLLRTREWLEARARTLVCHYHRRPVFV